MPPKTRSRAAEKRKATLEKQPSSTHISAPEPKKPRISVDPSSISAEWNEALDIIDEAHLPHILPVKWDKTQQEHCKIAFDPASGKTYDLRSNKGLVSREPGKSAVRFITLSGSEFTMPGTNTPAAARLERYGELSESIIKNPHGDELAPCIAHGDYVKVEALQADHMQAKDQIMKRQRELVDKLNKDSDFASFLMQHSGMDKFFVKVGNEYFGTLFFYELYFNDIDNIWLICQACNLHKSNQDTIDWLSNQWLYGKEFIDYLAREELRNTPILKKVNRKQGLAQVAIDWFWERHACYASLVRQLNEKIIFPLQILGVKIDAVIGSGSLARARRLQASLDFKMNLMSEIVKTKGLSMPRLPSDSSHSSSQSDEHLQVHDESGNRLHFTVEQYEGVGKEVVKGMPDKIKTSFREKLRKVIPTTKKPGSDFLPSP